MLKKIWIKAKKIFWGCARITKTEKLVDLICWLVYECAHGKKVYWRRVESVKNYCLANHEAIMEIEPERERTVYRPAYFELSEGEKVKFSAPSIYVAFLDDVTVVGATGIILTNRDILFDAVRYDEEYRIKLPWEFRRKQGSGRMWMATDRDILEVDQAINLCGFGSGNYYHLTVEILSRLEYVNQLPNVGKHVPILIDERVRTFPQMEQLLHVMNSDREIIYVPSRKRIKVHSLIQPSMNTWMPMNVESWDKFKISDNLIAKSGIENIRQKADEFMTERSERKIFISRKNCSSVRLMNEAELLPIFESNGFEIVCTESLTYMEQVEMFSSARCVVSASGAALTNIIYCHPGTVLGCIFPREYNFCIYSTLSYLVGGKSLFLNPDIIVHESNIVSEQYRVDKDQCGRYIEELLKMCSVKET